MSFSFEHVVPAIYVSQRLDAYLSKVLEGKFSREEIKAGIVEKKVLLNGKPAKPSSPVQQGDRIQASLSARPAVGLEGEDIALKIHFEDDSIVVVEKPAGMVVHPGAGNRKGTLVNALLGRGGALSSLGGVERPGIVHRLDKETSGILLTAKNNAAHRALQSQFASRSLSKTYTTLVKGPIEFEEGRVLEPIGHDPKIRHKMAVSSHEKAREAESYYRVVRRFRYSTLLEVRIVTGRTHQIRVHMAHLGHPVVGDAVYGSGKPGDRLCLHASKIEFLHPKSGKLMTFESEIPRPMAEMIRKAEQGESVR